MTFLDGENLDGVDNTFDEALRRSFGEPNNNAVSVPADDDSNTADDGGNTEANADNANTDTGLDEQALETEVESNGGDATEEVEPEPAYELTIQTESGPQTVQLTQAQVQSYYLFEQRLAQDKALAEYLANFDPDKSNSAPSPGAEGQHGDSTPPAGPSLDDLDMDDPNVAFLVKQYQDLQRSLDEIKQGVTRHDTVINTQAQQQAQSIVTKVTGDFKTAHDLNDEEIQNLSSIAARTGVINTYMAGIHPITGLPVPPDPIQAMNLALDMALHSTPEFREKENRRILNQQRQERSRANKASALSGNSGSSPRGNPVPKNDAERRSLMVQEVAAEMGQGL